MSIIQVTPEKLNSEADRLLRLKKQHEDEMKKLRTLVDGLGGKWKGQAHDAFVAEFNSMQYSFRNFAELLESYADLMRSSASQLQQTDRNMKNKIRKI